jgi:drug/metabolite transporter (DMT)-like permease
VRDRSGGHLLSVVKKMIIRNRVILRNRPIIQNLVITKDRRDHQESLNATRPYSASAGGRTGDGPTCGGRAGPVAARNRPLCDTRHSSSITTGHTRLTPVGAGHPTRCRRGRNGKRSGVISVVFALLTALSNASASVLQRRAARDAPEGKAFKLSLLGYLVHRGVWIAGIGMTIVAAVCQAAALDTGPIALVQPLFIVELPFALLLAGLVMRRRLPGRTWIAVGVVTAGLALVLACAAPSGGTDTAPASLWTLALLATGGFEAALLTASVRTRGHTRAALLGLAAACGYALTAALMKQAISALNHGAVQFFSTWQLYATAAVGLGSLFLLQNALQAGSLVASQPMLTMGDALISVCLGVLLFGETIRLDWWLVPQIFGLIVIAIGYIELSRSPIVAGLVQPNVA